MTPRSSLALLACLLCPVSSAAEDSYVETQAAPVRDTNSQARVNAAELETTSPRTADDLLAAVPGLVAVQHGNEGKGLQFYLRGFDAVHGSDFGVSMEGIPLNEFSNVHGHGYVDLGFIVPEAISHLDVTRGAYTMEQGNFATAGSVDLGLGAAPWDAGTSLTYEAGTTNRHRVMAMDADSDGGVVAAEALFDEGFGEGRQSLRTGITSKQRLIARKRAALDAIVVAGASRFELPGALRLADVESGERGFYDSYEVGRGDTRRGLAALKASGRGGWGKYTLIGYAIARSLDIEENFTGYLRNPELGDRRRQQEGSFVAGMRSSMRYDFSPHVHFDVNFDVRHHRLRQFEDSVLMSGEAWQRNRELSGAMTQAASAISWGFVNGCFGLDVGSRSEVFVYGSLTDSDRVLLVAAPRASARYLLDDFTIFSAVGLGYRAPELRAVFSQPPPAAEAPDDAELFDGGDPDVSVAANGEVGVRWYRPMFEAGLTGFAVHVAREVLFDHVSGVNIERSSTRRLGAELDLEVRPHPLFQLAADVALVDARFVDTDNPVPGAPRVLGTLRAFAGKPATFRAGVSTTYLGVRPLAFGARAADSVLVGVTAAAQLGAFELGVDVDNVLARRFRDGEYHFASWWDRAEPRSELPSVHVVAGPPLTARAHLTYRFRSEEHP